MREKKYDVVGIDMPCMDLNLTLDQFPRRGHGAGVRELSWQGGNKVASGMVACARLGGRCAMMGCVGGDIFGMAIMRDFARHGIDASAMQVRASDTTSLAVVLSDAETMQRTIVFKSGTVSRYTLDELDPGKLRSAEYLFVSHGGGVLEQAVDIARAAGVKIFIDADGYSEEIDAMIPKIDVFVGSEFYYETAFGNDNSQFEENCRAVMARGPSIVVFTMGEKGCVGVGPEGFFQLPAFPVKAIDTVGAGDVYHGAFLAGLLRGYGAEETARFASAVAAIKCTRIGGRAGIPDFETVQRFLRDGTIDYEEIDRRVKHYERGLENVPEGR